MPIDKELDTSIFDIDHATYEDKRVAALKSYEILNEQNVKELDHFTELASIICDVPLAAVSLVDASRQWFKSKKGFTVDYTDKSISFCQHAIIGNHFYEIPDTLKNDLFRKNPLVTGNPFIRYYGGYPLIDPNGFALGTLCIMDHQPKKLSEKQKYLLSILAKEVISEILSRKELLEKNHFEELFMRSIDMVCMAGTDGFFRKVNPAFSVCLGWSNKELLAIPFIDFVHPDDKVQTLQELSKLSQGFRSINFDNRYLTKSGEYKILSWVANPDSSKGLIYAIARDKTESMAAERQLVMAEKKFREVFENSPDAIFVEDLAGNILDVNEAGAAMQGCHKEELAGSNIRDLVPKENYVKVLCDYKKLFFGTIKTVESLLWSKLRGEIPIEISGKKIHFGEHQALLLQVRDISERKRIDKERIRAINDQILQHEEEVNANIKIQEEERNRIATEMHDEVGADLSRISILGQVIRKSTFDNNVIQQIDKILVASTNVQENISSIIWAMNPKNDTLENLVSYINFYASEYLETCGIEVKINLPANIPAITVNSKTRRNIFLLIKESINNLVKYSEATKVTIDISTDPGLFMIRIRDNGVGFNTDEIPRFSNGIYNMKQRVTDIGGEFFITSKKLYGTTVLLKVVLKS